jgi:hypothetical protein
MKSSSAFITGCTAGFTGVFAVSVALAVACPWFQYGAWMYLQHLVLMLGVVSGGIFGWCAWALGQLPRRPVSPGRGQMIQKGPQ